MKNIQITKMIKENSVDSGYVCPTFGKQLLAAVKKFVGFSILGAIVFVPPIMIFYREGFKGVLEAYGMAVLFAGIFCLAIWLVSSDNGR